MLTPSCADLLASDATAVASVCQPTLEARQAAARDLVALGGVDDVRVVNARRSGAIALAGVAAGCGE